MAGRLNNAELSDLVAPRIERYRLLGNTDVVFGSPEWRDLAMSLCFSEYEGLARTAERDEGDFTGLTLVPFLSTPPMEEDPVQPVPLRRLFADYIATRKLVGKGHEAERRWAPVIKDLISFLGHSDAGKLTKTDLRKWRDAKMSSLAPKTVSVVYLAAIRTILQWAVENDVLPANEAATVRQEVPRKVRSREQGYTTSEANRILSAARSYDPACNCNHQCTETPATTAAKRWVPFLCALTGARIVEITQLRRQDIRL